MTKKGNNIPDNEQEILLLVRNSKTLERGFRLLVQTYQERLYWHVRKLVQVHEDANEVLQNTFIKVYKNILKFRGDSKLYTWLYRIATNESFSFLEKAKRKKRATSIDDEESVVAHQLKADSYFCGDDAALLLQEAIATLPEKQKIVFTMRYFDEMPYKELAIILNTSVGGLKASYHHAVKKIETFLKNKIGS